MQGKAALQGLRINCWLAAMLPAVLLAGLLIAIGGWVEEQQRSTQADGLRRSLKAYVAGGMGREYRSAAALENLLLSDRWWQGVQRLQLTGDGEVQLEASAGIIQANHELPPPDLILAVTDARAWCEGRDGGRLLRAAAPLTAANGSFDGLLYAEVVPAPITSRRWFAWAASLVLLLGAAMAWYLARRIYRPVDALCEQANAALSGRSLPARLVSKETKALASAVSALAEAYMDNTAEAKRRSSGPQRPAGTVHTVADRPVQPGSSATQPIPLKQHGEQ